jgi:hypothetical protein
VISTIEIRISPEWKSWADWREPEAWTINGDWKAKRPPIIEQELSTTRDLRTEV